MCSQGRDIPVQVRLEEIKINIPLSTSHMIICIRNHVLGRYLTNQIVTGLYVLALTPIRVRHSSAIRYQPGSIGILIRQQNDSGKMYFDMGKASIFYFSSLIIRLLSINCPSTITASIFLVLLISSNGLSDIIIISACFADSMVPTSLSIPKA